MRPVAQAHQRGLQDLPLGLQLHDFGLQLLFLALQFGPACKALVSGQRMVGEIEDQGADGAREKYGFNGLHHPVDPPKRPFSRPCPRPDVRPVNEK